MNRRYTRTYLRILISALVVGLTACDQGTTTPLHAIATTQSYARMVSQAYPGRQMGPTNWPGSHINLFGAAGSTPPTNNAPSYSAWWGGQYNPNHNTWGQHLLYPSMSDEVSRCQAMVDGIPQHLQNLELMVATLERCLFRLSVHRSAPMNALWRSGDPEILQMGAYLTDYVRPNPYGNHGYSPYFPFLTSGQTSYVPVSNF